MIRDLDVGDCFIEQMEFAADGKHILNRFFCFGGQYVALLDLDTGVSTDFSPEEDAGSSSIDGMALAPDGNHAAAAYDRITFEPDKKHDYFVAVYEGAGQKPKYRLEGFDSKITDLAYTPDNRLLAVGQENGQVSLWDSSSMMKMKIFPSPGAGVTQITFSPDGRGLAVSHRDGWIRLWNTADGAPIRKMDGQGADALVFSNTESTLISAGAKAPVIRWEIDSGTARGVYPFESLFSESNPGWSLDISPDGNYLAAGGKGGGILLFDLEDMHLVRTFDNPANFVQWVAFSPDGETLVSSADGTIRLWDVPTGAVSLSLAGDYPVFSPDGKWIAYSTTTKDHQNDKVIIFDRIARKPRLALDAHLPKVSAFTYDGRSLVFMAGNGISQWNFDRQEKTVLWENSQVGGVQFASVPGKNIMAAASAFFGLILFDIDAGGKRPAPELDTLYSLYPYVGFSPDGRLGVYLSGSTAVWDLEFGIQVASAAGHTCDATSADFTPDGKLLATSAFDGTILVWNLAELMEKFTKKDS